MLAEKDETFMNHKEPQDLHKGHNFFLCMYFTFKQGCLYFVIMVPSLCSLWLNSFVPEILYCLWIIQDFFPASVSNPAAMSPPATPNAR